jgi:hypothetical protein
LDNVNQVKDREQMLHWLLENFFTWDTVDLPYTDDEEGEVFGGWYTTSVGDHNALEIQHDKIGYISETDFKRGRISTKIKFKGVDVTVYVKDRDTATYTFNTKPEADAFLIGLDASHVQYKVIKGDHHGSM